MLISLQAPVRFPAPGEAAPRTIARLREMGEVVPVLFPGDVPVMAATSASALRELLSDPT
ncbi:hypothetical protein [Actinomadura nitritigenes]|uniref:hypothetical protein n=1 Tax=Actinomadura nitritigenes TaxID=134602 RepID=UPI003D92E7AB